MLRSRHAASLRPSSTLLRKCCIELSWIAKALCRPASSKADSLEEAHNTTTAADKLDAALSTFAVSLLGSSPSVLQLYEQYQHEAGVVIDRVIPYEEHPKPHRRADASIQCMDGLDKKVGDGLVLVVHAVMSDDNPKTLKTTVCSGFVVDASLSKSQQGDIIVTCAHTLEEIYRYIRRKGTVAAANTKSVSFVLPVTGTPRVTTGLLSSMPRSDVIVIEAIPTTVVPRLRPLPLTPFPVYPGTPILTHLFGSSNPPKILHSIARTRNQREAVDTSQLKQPISWPAGLGWRRWGVGVMLGYRSYTGLELEAGISSVLPHILTSILPTPGSSGGPLVNGDTGCIVGMTSGRRMDNRVEGERGWGCSAEGIFEMFSLPGFMPSNT